MTDYPNGPAPETPEYWAFKQPDALAIVDSERSITYRDLNTQADKLASALRSHGLGAGDVVAVRTQTRLEWPVISLALAKLECQLLVLNWRLTPPEVAGIMQSSRAAGLICDDADLTALVAGVDLSSLKVSVSLDAASPAFVSYDALVYGNNGTPVSTFHSRKPAPLILFTSGTTGEPKGIAVRPDGSQKTSEYLADIRAMHPVGPGDVILLTVPLHFRAGATEVSNAIRAGAKLVLLPRFDALETLRAMQAHRVTKWFGVPTMYRRIAALGADVVKGFDLRALNQLVIGAAPADKSLKLWILDNLGDCLREGYGSTEVGLSTGLAPEFQRAKVASCGRPFRHVDISIRDEAGRSLPPQQRGEIWIRTPVTIKTYLDDVPLRPDTRDEAGYFFTGDIGYFDDEGFLYICDRAKDMIISGGANIYPAEIESVLLAHPAIADAAVIGIPDDEFGESVAAFCELKPNCIATTDALLEHCSKSLATYKRPKKLTIIGELPRNAVGKVLKRELRAPYWQGRARSI